MNRILFARLAPWPTPRPAVDATGIRAAGAIRPRHWCAALALAGCGTAAALAVTPQEALHEVVRCSSLADSAARLQCYDAAAARAQTALDGASAPDAPAAANPRDGFGLPRSSPPVTRPEQFGKPPPSPVEELRSISATVIEFARTPRGKALFVLDNGQVWRQIDADSSDISHLPGRPPKVTIERGALGSYNLSIEGSNGAVKVNRLR